MAILDQNLLAKIGNKINKSTKYVRERVSKRARRKHITSEAELIIWADELKIGVSNSTRKLNRRAQDQIDDYYAPKAKSFANNKQGGFRFFVQTDKKADHWYNLWWVQLIIGFFLVGVVAGTISQILGAYFSVLFKIVNP